MSSVDEIEDPTTIFRCAVAFDRQIKIVEMELTTHSGSNHARMAVAYSSSFPNFSVPPTIRQGRALQTPLS